MWCYWTLILYIFRQSEKKKFKISAEVARSYKVFTRYNTNGEMPSWQREIYIHSHAWHNKISLSVSISKHYNLFHFTLHSHRTWLLCFFHLVINFSHFICNFFFLPQISLLFSHNSEVNVHVTKLWTLCFSFLSFFFSDNSGSLWMWFWPKM